VRADSGPPIAVQLIEQIRRASSAHLGLPAAAQILGERPTAAGGASESTTRDLSASPPRPPRQCPDRRPAGVTPPGPRQRSARCVGPVPGGRAARRPGASVTFGVQTPRVGGLKTEACWPPADRQTRRRRGGASATRRRAACLCGDGPRLAPDATTRNQRQRTRQPSPPGETPAHPFPVQGVTGSQLVRSSASSLEATSANRLWHPRGGKPEMRLCAQGPKPKHRRRPRGISR